MSAILSSSLIALCTVVYTNSEAVQYGSDSLSVCAKECQQSEQNYKTSDKAQDLKCVYVVQPI